MFCPLCRPIFLTSFFKASFAFVPSLYHTFAPLSTALQVFFEKFLKFGKVAQSKPLLYSRSVAVFVQLAQRFCAFSVSAY
jgi:hypothetical protein